MKTVFAFPVTVVLFLLLMTNVRAQNTFPATGSAGIGTAAPDASALLEIKSNTQGLLIPRMTLAKRDAIVTPAIGLMIYQTNNTPGFYYFTGVAWAEITPATLNKNLSNLSAPTKINTELLPDTNNTIDLGSPSQTWKDLYLNGNVYNGGLQTISFVGNGDAFFGQNAGRVTTGSFNTFLGSEAGSANTTGTSNTFAGNSSGNNNMTGNRNSFYGSNSGVFNRADDNSFFGAFAGDANTTGTVNSFFGKDAGGANTSGSNNSFFGALAGLVNTNGVANAFFGARAGIANTTSSNNSFFGALAGEANTTGSRNSFFGKGAGLKNTTGSNNSFFGDSAGFTNTNGTGVAAFGYQAGGTRSNSFCTFFGFQSDNVTGSNLSNANAFGYLSRVTAANTCRIGNSVMASIGGFEDWTNVSDARFKKNIKENVKGLDFINRLRPVTYNLDVTGLKHFLKEDNAENMPASQSKEMQDAVAVKEKEIKTGFIAQEVEVAAKASGYDFSGVDKPQNDESFYGLRYAEFTVPLVKAVQELSKMNDEKDAKIDDLQKQINELKQMMIPNTPNNISLSDASLEQNIPNPFNHTTTINYTLPQKFTTAQIMITDKNGKTLKLVNVSGTGKGKINVDASTLAAGAYNYSLLVDGKLIGTKQMEHIK